MTSTSQALAAQYDEYRTAARKAYDLLSKKPQGFAKLLTSKSVLSAVEEKRSAAEKQMQEADKLLSAARPCQSLESLAQATSICAEGAKVFRSSRGGRLALTSAEAQEIKKLNGKVQRGLKEWSQAQSKYLKQTLPLFDAAYYLSQGSVKMSHGDAGAHYLQLGWKEGRNPHPLFDVKWYLEANPDVAKAGAEPLTHYFKIGWREGRHPHPLFDAKRYLRQNPDVAHKGFEPLTHYLTQGWKEFRDPNKLFSIRTYLAEQNLPFGEVEPLTDYVIRHWDRGLESQPPSDDEEGITDSATVLRNRFGSFTEPLAFFGSTEKGKRLSIVMDHLSPGNFLDGMGTVLILAVHLARRLGCSLRLISRQQVPAPEVFQDALKAGSLEWKDEVEFVEAHAGPWAAPIDLSPDDLFLTTSWTTTKSMMQNVDKSRIIYLLLEDESLLYPDGDERLRCRNLLAETGISMVVQTHMLYRHLVLDGFSNLNENALWFEPSSPCNPERKVLAPQEPERKRNFLFYARPDNRKNLFGFGLHVIEAAIMEGLFPEEEWDITFAGKDLEPMHLLTGISPKLVQGLRWGRYMEKLQTTDLALSLVSAPHPSHPTLDLAAAGAVVVSNTYGINRGLENYSKNIICGELTLPSLLNTLRVGARLSADRAARQQHVLEDRILRDWNASFVEVLDWLCARHATSAP